MSDTDLITNDTTLQLHGTAEPSSTVTVSRAGLGVLGSTSASVGGTFTYNYTGTTLTDGSYTFTATATSGGSTSDPSPPFLVTVDTTPPSVTVNVPASTTDLSPEVRLYGWDRIGVGTTYALDVDLNNDNDFVDASEANYATGTLVDGSARLNLPELPSTGTYKIRGRLLDIAGNQGTSATMTFQVVSTTTWDYGTADDALDWDVGSGNRGLQTGAVVLVHGLDLDTSPGTHQGGNPALVYDSATVSVRPIIRTTVQTPNNAALPASISLRLTFNGVAEATVTYSTTGFSPGDVLLAAAQVSTPITTTNRYGFSLLVQPSGQSATTLTGSTYVVVNDNGPLGAGWTFAGVDRLVSFSADANGPAGMLRIYGSGGWRFYEGTSTFISPLGDNGTLSLSGGTYTYSTPDGQSWTFNSSGYLTQWTSADGQESLLYRLHLGQPHRAHGHRRHAEHADVQRQHQRRHPEQQQPADDADPGQWRPGQHHQPRHRGARLHVCRRAPVDGRGIRPD